MSPKLVNGTLSLGESVCSGFQRHLLKSLTLLWNLTFFSASFEMCSFFKNLGNVLPVNEAFQNTCLHSQRADEVFYLLLEEVLSLTPPRPGFHSVSLHFALG